MTRRIIQIDEEKCIGCEACVSACQEGAIGMVDGKARLLREDHCDGLGNCLPNCPADAISFIEKEISPAGCNTQDKKTEFNKQGEELPCGCPGNQSKQIKREVAPSNVLETVGVQSQLTQWPVQIKLAPINAPYFNNANLLIAADCTAYAYADFHNKFIKNKVCLIGCPKLDEGDYADKLTAIIKNNDIKSVTVARMEVPCCGGIESAVKRALQASGKFIPWQIVTISTDGKILD